MLPEANMHIQRQSLTILFFYLAQRHFQQDMSFFEKQIKKRPFSVLPIRETKQVHELVNSYKVVGDYLSELTDLLSNLLSPYFCVEIFAFRVYPVHDITAIINLSMRINLIWLHSLTSCKTVSLYSELCEHKE
jgi:hypothetical protein